MQRTFIYRFPPTKNSRQPKHRKSYAIVVHPNRSTNETATTTFTSLKKKKHKHFLHIFFGIVSAQHFSYFYYITHWRFIVFVFMCVCSMANTIHHLGLPYIHSCTAPTTNTSKYAYFTHKSHMHNICTRDLLYLSVDAVMM